jgi:BirA family biotin operon repressor/biotin-[acetyl-CoA-carboxylase] ligase
MTRRATEAAADTTDSLDSDGVLALVPPAVAQHIERLDVFAVLDSTNRYLLDAPAPAAGRVHIAIADHQHAGRGRRGRRWNVPPGAGLCLSAALRFASPPDELAALPLAAGVAARRAVAAVCGVDVGLKWPNDLVWDGRKLGGVLVERAAAVRCEAHAVIGIGINVAVPADTLATLSDWPGGATDLATATGGRPPARRALAAALIAELVELAHGFETRGFGPYRHELGIADVLRDREVRVVAGADGAASIGADGTSGIARGIDPDGALVIELADGSRRRVLAGDASIRPGRDVDDRESDHRDSDDRESDGRDTEGATG